jgi:hypothetical protein
MSRTIRAFQPLSGDPAFAISTFTDDPERWLPHARHVAPQSWDLQVGAGGFDRPVRVTVGAPWNMGRTWWRSWSWSPLAETRDPVSLERLLPDLDAELGLAVAEDGQLTLVLDGRYRPPGGRVGDALDAVGMGRVARRTLERLLAAIADRLGGPPAGQGPDDHDDPARVARDDRDLHGTEGGATDDEPVAVQPPM